MTARRPWGPVGPLKDSARHNGLCFISVRADTSAVRAFEQRTGGEVPSSGAQFLKGIAGSSLVELGTREEHSRTFLSRLLAFPRVGIAAPVAAGKPVGRNRHYYICYWPCEGRSRFVAARQSEDLVGSRALEDVPEVYAQVLSCFDEILLDPFGLHCGFVGPHPGIGVLGFAREFAIIRESRDRFRDADLLPSGEPDVMEGEALEDFLPIYCDGMGNTYLTEKGRDKHELFFFDHETCVVKDTGRTIEDLLSTFWERPDDWL